MKKTLFLILVSSFLIASLAGSALAGPCTIAVNPGTLNVADGTATGTIIVDHYTDAGTRAITLSTTSNCISVQVNGMSAPTTGNDIFHGGIPQGRTYTVSGTKAVAGPNKGFLVDASGNMVSTTFTLTVIRDFSKTFTPCSFNVYDNLGTVYGDTSVSVTGQVIDFGATSGAASIPEFPTIAVPVAAVLGIIFLIGRKKGDM